MIRRLLFALLAAAPLPALANDSTAELGTGGIILSRTDIVTMDKEVLNISEDEVTVDYVFRNQSDEDVETLVAFPMPNIEGNPWWMPAIPQDGDNNFLGFEVTIDGEPAIIHLEQRAFAVGVEVTEELRRHQVPMYPGGEEAYKALEQLPDDVAEDWRMRGMLVIDEYDDGNGMQQHRSPFWQLKSTFWWNATFPAGKPVEVSHRYKPSVGGTAGLTFFYDGKFDGTFKDYEAKYCIDDAFKRAVIKAAKNNPDGYPQLYETRISYVLTTGGNWGGSTIGDFTLTVDKGDTRNLVSFCGTGIKKIGQTTFQMKAMDYYPAKDVDILLLKPFDAIEDASASRAAPLGPAAAEKPEGKRVMAPNAPKMPEASRPPTGGTGDEGG